MLNKTEGLHKLWRIDLFSLPQWEDILPFGLGRPDTSSLPTRQKIDLHITDLEKFENDFITLCHNFKFVVESPSYDPHTKILFKTGKLGLNVAKQSLVLFETIQKSKQDKNNEPFALIEHSGNLRTGPPKTPSFFAESILVGLELHRGSNEGLRLLRTFLETVDKSDGSLKPQDRLALWLDDNSQYSKELIHIFVATTDTKEISVWAKGKRQTLKRIVLSYELNKNVKTFTEECKVPLAKLESRILERAQKIKLKYEENNL